MVAIRKVPEIVCMLCCQVFPCKVYIDSNLRDILRYD
jgi:hypothetical protein